MANQQPERAKPQNRAEMQRDRILDAAEKCFIKHGFHVASMANISEEANISTGLIYRYFENKHAIILAIIERQLQERRADIESLHTDADLPERICELLRSWKHNAPGVMNPVLFLEMSAEASRNPEISDALGNADQISRNDFNKWLRKLATTAGAEPSDEDLERRALALQCLVEGMALRTIREPELRCPALSDSIRHFLPHLLSFDEEE